MIRDILAYLRGVSRKVFSSEHNLSLLDDIWEVQYLRAYHILRFQFDNRRVFCTRFYFEQFLKVLRFM